MAQNLKWFIAVNILFDTVLTVLVHLGFYISIKKVYFGENE